MSHQHFWREVIVMICLDRLFLIYRVLTDDLAAQQEYRAYSATARARVAAEMAARVLRTALGVEAPVVPLLPPRPAPLSKFQQRRVRKLQKLHRVV